MKNKLSIVHNLYHRNEFVNESVRLNLLALEESGVDYQYILFNDKGDIDIKDDVKEFISEKVEYIYSDINYGKKKCCGGWLGALPYVNGNLIQITGQDDVMTSLFYKKSIDVFDNRDDIYLVFANGFRVSENLNCDSMMINPDYILSQPGVYENPLEVFKVWYGINSKFNKTGSDVVSCANNGIVTPGTIYRVKLHDLIGVPDLDNCGGACDFEYWSRILFNEYKCHYINSPLWLYRLSEYSAGLEVIDGKKNNEYWRKISLEWIKNKYTRLWEEKRKLKNTISIT